jgi:hypothetical protein
MNEPVDEGTQALHDIIESQKERLALFVDILLEQGFDPEDLLLA